MAVQAIKRSDGSIVAPMRAEADGIIGDGVAVLNPGDPMYDEWDNWLTNRESASE